MNPFLLFGNLVLQSAFFPSSFHVGVKANEDSVSQHVKTNLA